jgi:hypothetical protein
MLDLPWRESLRVMILTDGSYPPVLAGAALACERLERPYADTRTRVMEPATRNFTGRNPFLAREVHWYHVRGRFTML